MGWCLYCNKELIGYHPNARYCNNDCKNALAKSLYVKRIQIMVRCFMCGEWFETPQSIAKYCTRACASKAARIRNPERFKNYEKGRSKSKAVYIKEYVKNPPTRKILKCVFCDKTLDRSSPHNTMCCNECHYKLRKNNEQKRLSRQRQVESTLSNAQWRDVLVYFNNSCAYCGVREGNGSLQQDHVVPVTKGGEHTHNNIIPACHGCNPSKRDKDMHAWYSKQPFYSVFKEKKIYNWLGYNGVDAQQLCVGV